MEYGDLAKMRKMNFGNISNKRSNFRTFGLQFAPTLVLWIIYNMGKICIILNPKMSQNKQDWRLRLGYLLQRAVRHHRILSESTACMTLSTQ